MVFSSASCNYRAVLLFLAGIALHGPSCIGQLDFNRQDTLRGSITPARAWWDLTYCHLSIAVLDTEKNSTSLSSMSPDTSGLGTASSAVISPTCGYMKVLRPIRRACLWNISGGKMPVQPIAAEPG